MKIVYQSACRTISLLHVYSECNVFEPGYEAGQFPPHYPVPATVKVDPLIEAYILRHIIAWLRSEH